MADSTSLSCASTVVLSKPLKLGGRLNEWEDRDWLAELPWLLWQVSSPGSRELFTLSVVASAIGIAYGSAVLFSVSFTLGAFFAGMVMRESEFSHRAAQESLPLRDAFARCLFGTVFRVCKHVEGQVLIGSRRRNID